MRENLRPDDALASVTGIGELSSPASRGAARLRSAAVILVLLFPLIVLPGAEHPFSTPKLLALLGAVVAGTVLAGVCGLLRRSALPKGLSAALLAWLALFGASAVFGEQTSFAVLLLSLAGAGWFLLLMVIRQRPERLALAMALSGGTVALVALLQFAGVDPFSLAGWIAVGGSGPRMRVYATLGNPNFVAAFLVALLPLATFLNDALRSRGLAILFLILLGVAIFATGSRAAVPALALALVWMSLLGGFARLRHLAAAAGILAVLLPVFAPARSLATTLRGRYYIWEVVAPHIREVPLLGFGPGALPVKWKTWETEYWKSGVVPEAEKVFAGPENHSHNEYLEMLVDSGEAGLAAFLGLVAAFLFFIFGRARRNPSRLPSAASAGLVALLAIALVDFPFHRPTELFVFWTLMAVAWLAAANPVEGRDPTAPDDGHFEN